MGKFSLKIAYNCLIENDRFASDRIFKEVWRLQAPQRLKAFMWIVAHDALLTNAARVRRGMANDDKCILCDKLTKTMLHVLRDCDKAKDLWTSVGHSVID